MAFWLFSKSKKDTTQNKERNKVNPNNCYGSVRCIAEGTCGHRFTPMCNKCGNNIGPEPFKSYFVERE